MHQKADKRMSVSFGKKTCISCSEPLQPNSPKNGRSECYSIQSNEVDHAHLSRSALQVRLRDPLPVLCRNPEIYDRSKVSADCFDALHCLHMLRKVNRMREAAEQNLFPGAAQLIQVWRRSTLSWHAVIWLSPLAWKWLTPEACSSQV